MKFIERRELVHKAYEKQITGGAGLRLKWLIDFLINILN